MEQSDNPYTVSCVVSSKNKPVREISHEHQSVNFPLLIDLETVGNITENCLENWFENIGKPDFYNKIPDILSKSGNGHPAKVIPHVAKMIGIDNFETILQQKGWY
jgi:hypothetical protein